MPADLADRLLGWRENPTIQAGEGLALSMAELIDGPVAGVVVYGSFARGEAHPGDVDFLILAEDDARGGLWGTSGTMAIDGHVVPVQSTLSEDPAKWFYVADGAVLFERGDLVTEWLGRIRAALASERRVLPSELLRDRVWLHRMVDRVRRQSDKDPTVAMLRAAMLITVIPDIYARMRSELGRSASQWIEHIRVQDPEIARMFDELAACWSAGAATDVLERLAGALDP